MNITMNFENYKPHRDINYHENEITALLKQMCCALTWHMVYNVLTVKYISCMKESEVKKLLYA